MTWSLRHDLRTRILAGCALGLAATSASDLSRRQRVKGVTASDFRQIVAVHFIGRVLPTPLEQVCTFATSLRSTCENSQLKMYSVVRDFNLDQLWARQLCLDYNIPFHITLSPLTTS